MNSEKTSEFVIYYQKKFRFFIFSKPPFKVLWKDVVIKYGSPMVGHGLRTGSEMEKAYIIAHSKLRVCKISTQKTQNCAKLAKMPKIAQKKAKIFNKTHEKNKHLHSCSKLAHAARALGLSFSSSGQAYTQLYLSHFLWPKKY